jgi:hypothetical protein
VNAPDDTPIPLIDPSELPRPPADPGDAATLPPGFDDALARARRILEGDIRPGDYLLVTPEVRRLTDREMEWARARCAAAGFTELDPCVERRQLEQNLLRVHCRDQHVAYIADDNGVVVVITGLTETGEMLRRLPPELWSGRVAVGYVDDSCQLL